MTAIDFILIPLVLFSGHYIIGVVTKSHRLQADRPLLTKLFYYHLSFSILYATYVTFFGGDSPGYWKFPRFYRTSWFDLHQPGTPFIHFITFPFSQWLGVSFWGGTVLFSLFGFGGIVCFFLTLKRVLFVNPKLFGFKLFPLVLFLPNMHFWSGGVGKDSVIFFALCLFIFALTNVKANILGIVISFYLAFFVRPHIAMVMVVALGISLLLGSRGISAFWRVTFLVMSIVVFVVISPKVFEFIGVDQESIESVEDISTIRSQNLSRSRVGSRIEITAMPIPLRMFTFLYRPLFIDGVNAFGMIVSIENLFYLLLTLSALRWKLITGFFRLPLVLKTSVIIVVATTFFMSGSMGNLGITIRQKNMVMFMVLMLTMFLLSERQALFSMRFRTRRRPMSPDTGQSAE